MSHTEDDYDWPDDPATGADFEQPGVFRLTILYVSPLVLLLLFPPLAWLALLPMAVSMRWTVYPPHRSRLAVIYTICGLISVAPLLVRLVT